MHQKVGSGRSLKSFKISQQVAKTLRPKHELVQSIWAEYLKSQSVTANITAANRNAKSGVLPDCRYVTKNVQEFVKERRSIRTRTGAKDVTDSLASRNLVVVGQSKPSAVKEALQAVLRFFVAKRYRSCKKKGS